MRVRIGGGKGRGGKGNEGGINKTQRPNRAAGPIKGLLSEHPVYFATHRNKEEEKEK